MKNCEPLVSFPRLAIDSRNALSCLRVRFSSSHFCKRPLFKVATIYGLSSSSISFGEVASLDHEVLYNSVKRGAFEAKLFPCDFANSPFTSAQTEEVFTRLGANIRKKLKDYAPNWLPVELHIKVTLRAVFHPHCDQSPGDLCAVASRTIS